MISIAIKANPAVIEGSAIGRDILKKLFQGPIPRVLHASICFLPPFSKLSELSRNTYG